MLMWILWGQLLLAEEPVVFQGPNFSLSLPTHWVEISAEELRQMNEFLRQQAPTAAIPEWLAGFRETFSDSEEAQAYPYILVQQLDTGRLTDSQLRKPPDLNLGLQIKSEEHKLNGLVTDVATQRMVFDPELHLIWLKTHSVIDGVGPIQSLTAMIPTEKGLMHFNFYDLESDFPVSEPKFREIVKSIRLAPELAYKPRWTDAFVPVGMNDRRAEALGRVVGVLISAGVAGVVVRNLSRRKQKKKLAQSGPDEPKMGM